MASLYGKRIYVISGKRRSEYDSMSDDEYSEDYQFNRPGKYTLKFAQILKLLLFVLQIAIRYELEDQMIFKTFSNVYNP